MGHAPERLIRIGELQVGNRDFDNDVLTVLDQVHKPSAVAVWPSHRLELDDNFEIWAVPTYKCAS
jgi:hypothetical protein